MVLEKKEKNISIHLSDRNQSNKHEITVGRYRKNLK